MFILITLFFTFTNKNGQVIPKNINNSISSGIHTMPMKDNSSDNSNSFSLNRHKYMESFHTNNENIKLQKKFFGNKDSSSHIHDKKFKTIGNSSLNATGGNISFVSNFNNNTINSSLNRVRAGGSVVPKKFSMKK